MAARQSPDVVYEVKGLRELRAGLKAADQELPKRLSKIHREGAKKVAEDARGRLSALSRLQALASGAVKGSGTQLQSKIRVGAGNGVAADIALGATLGARRYKQFPPWIGQDWTVGEPGGPYGVGDAIAAGADQFIEEYDQALAELTRDAFPD